MSLLFSVIFPQAQMMSSLLQHLLEVLSRYYSFNQYFLFTTTSIPTLVPIHSPVQWVLGAHFPELKSLGCIADHVPKYSAVDKIKSSYMYLCSLVYLHGVLKDNFMWCTVAVLLNSTSFSFLRLNSDCHYTIFFCNANRPFYYTVDHSFFCVVRQIVDFLDAYYP